ncbi:MAG TPA: hypothetical protein PLJ50_14020, partial [Candidatus Latescibacteria bacterium]|nr:hypothetical protein [Candidatus Latescibacterota bacterium]
MRHRLRIGGLLFDRRCHAGQWWGREPSVDMGANVAREDGIVKGGETAGAVLWGWGGVFPHPSSASAEVSPLPVV